MLKFIKIALKLKKEHKQDYNGFKLHPLNTVMLLAGGQGALNLGFQLTLFHPRRADYAHRISVCPPGFENLTTSLKHKMRDLKIQLYKISKGQTKS